jgi:hypothetical protein
LAIGVNFPRDFERIAIGNIVICRANSQNLTMGVVDVSLDQFFDSILNVLWLVTNGVLGDARQVDQIQI